MDYKEALRQIRTKYKKHSLLTGPFKAFARYMENKRLAKEEEREVNQLFAGVDDFAEMDSKSKTKLTARVNSYLREMKKQEN
jgi:DNA-binding transcriptional regulator/RsmH inhibitor MraZ